MSIVPMKKISIIAMRSEKDALLKDLIRAGCVEISEKKEARKSSLRSVGSKALADTRMQQTRLRNALRVLDRYAPYKKGLLTPLPTVSEEVLLDEAPLEQAGETAAQILALDLDIRSIGSKENHERTVIESMKPWIPLDMPLEKTETETCRIVTGTIPATADLAALEAQLSGCDGVIYEISSDKTTRFVAAFYRKERHAEVIGALRQFSFSQLSMGGLTGTPQENIDRSNALLSQLAEKKEARKSEILAMADRRPALQLGIDTLSTVIDREEAQLRFDGTGSTVYFSGWIPAPKEEAVEGILSAYSCAWETAEPEEGDDVPITLKNNAVTRPYNLVTEMYSMPAYDGLDPNPFIMPFFALFFGIMFADMAYGLILLVAGILYKKKARPRGGAGNMAGLLIECGITTFVMGFLTGGFFGDAVSVIGSWFGKDWSIVPHLGTLSIAGAEINLPLNLLEGNNPLFVLIGAILLGGVHLAVGVGIGMYLKIRDGQWADALLNDLCWWVILAGLALMAFGKGTVVLFIGLGMLVLGNVITGKGIGKITGIFGAVYNGATGYLGDFLSYSRLMALMLAGSVIASVFNQLGSLGNVGGITIGGTILFVVVFAIGHTLNFGLNVIGCFVHTLRLQFLEFFGKWYRDGGRPFRPLSVHTKYYDIAKEETK